MSIIDKIKALTPGRKRAVILTALLILALPLLWVVSINFQTRANVLKQNREAGLNNLQLPEPSPQTKQAWEEVQQSKEDMDQFYSDMNALQNASSAPTTTNEYNFEDIPINVPEGF